MNDLNQIRIIRRPEVERRLQVSRQWIYDRINPKSKYYDPEFPKPIKLGNGKNPAVGWVESEIDLFLASQIAKSRKAA